MSFRRLFYSRTFIGIVILLLISAIYFVIFLKPNKVIIAKFNEVERIPRKLPLYYKGFKIGASSQQKLSKDRKNILVYLNINEDIDLPANIKIFLDTANKTKPYYKIIMPEVESKEPLKHYSTVEGEMSVSLKEMIQKQISSEMVQEGVQDIGSTIQGVNEATGKIANIAESIDLIIKENRKSINNSVKNVEATTYNLGLVVKNVNDVIGLPKTKEDMRATIANIRVSSENLKNFTSNIDKIATNKNIDEVLSSLSQSVENIEDITDNFKESSVNINESTKNVKELTEQLDCTLQRTNCILSEGTSTIKEVRELSCGTRDMLSKRFLFWKFLFGKPGKKLGEKPCVNCK